MKGSLKGSFASVRDCFVALIMASVLLAMTTGVWGCESGGGGGGDGSTGSNASNQASCDNYCNLCESDRMGDCMEDCLGDEDAPNLTQECLECTANATECEDIVYKKCLEPCRWGKGEKAICNSYCEPCNDDDSEGPEGESQQEFCMSNCSEYVETISQPCQECLINTQGCENGKYKYACGTFCDQ